MNFEDYRSCRLVEMTEQNRKYITKEIGKLLSDIWRIKGRAEQETVRNTRSPRSWAVCMPMLRNCYRKNLELVIDRSTKLANSALNHIRLRHDQAESSIASKTFFAAEHLSALVVSAAICSRSSTSIWPILNFVTRMPVMTASLCFAFLANYPSLTRLPGSRWPGPLW